MKLTTDTHGAVEGVSPTYGTDHTRGGAVARRYNEPVDSEREQ